ncbi:MAG TPA: hypothetical protein VK444_07640 [Methanobacteriaceae archaeon]|nr:hypothetical protein [Methanobacteriaceae archaeon]
MKKEDNNRKIALEELFYLLMSSWIYSIEKTRDELLGENIAYTRRLGWNATEYIMEHLKTTCNVDMAEKTDSKNILDLMENIVKCLEDIDFIRKDTVTIGQKGDSISIAMTRCRADACKDLVSKGLMPKVCLRSIVLANFLENITGREFTYTLDADPESQPEGTCTSYLGET